MPRTNFCKTEEDPTKSIIYMYMGAELIKPADLSKRTGIPESTLYSNLKTPGNFKKWQLNKICRTLKISDDDKAKML